MIDLSKEIFFVKKETQLKIISAQLDGMILILNEQLDLQKKILDTKGTGGALNQQEFYRRVDGKLDAILAQQIKPVARKLF